MISFTRYQCSSLEDRKGRDFMALKMEKVELKMERSRERDVTKYNTCSQFWRICRKNLNKHICAHA